MGGSIEYHLGVTQMGWEQKGAYNGLGYVFGSIDVHQEANGVAEA